MNGEERYELAMRIVDLAMDLELVFQEGNPSEFQEAYIVAKQITLLVEEGLS